VKLAEKSLHKDSKVLIEGALRTRKWTGKDEVEKSTTEIVLQPFNGSLTLLDAPKPAPERPTYRQARAQATSRPPRLDRLFVCCAYWLCASSVTAEWAVAITKNSLSSRG